MVDYICGRSIPTYFDISTAALCSLSDHSVLVANMPCPQGGQSPDTASGVQGPTPVDLNPNPPIKEPLRQGDSWVWQEWASGGADGSEELSSERWAFHSGQDTFLS